MGRSAHLEHSGFATHVPELPEVETTRRGIAPHITGQTISKVIIRERRLRWPIQRGFAARLTGASVGEVRRRAKYLVIAVGEGHILLHLGMSGSLRVLHDARRPGTHDHLDIVFGEALRLRYNETICMSSRAVEAVPSKIF